MPTDFDALDRADPLTDVAARFEPGHAGVLYFDANSIGAMPITARERIERVLDEWRELRRGGWAESDWLDAPLRLGDKLAPIIGARAGEIAVGDSTSVNLFKALGAALRLRPGRTRIVTEIGSFPTDLYAAQALARLFPGVEIVYAREGEDPRTLVDARCAALYLSHVDYCSARRHDLAALSAHAHTHGALSVWDLSHSAGANPIDLVGAAADFAVGCGYKYLCGGPGAPGYIRIAAHLQQACDPILAGWMGHADKFAFAPDYAPAPGIARQIVGTPAVIANAVFEAALDVWRAVDLAAAFAKHARLGDLALNSIAQATAAAGVSIASPRAAGRRGGFVAIGHAQAKAIVAALEDHGVIASYRPPDVIRFGLSPLYHRYRDIGALVERLARIVNERLWDRPQYLQARTT